jgi:hypothetical protein
VGQLPVGVTDHSLAAMSTPRDPQMGHRVLDNVMSFPAPRTKGRRFESVRGRYAGHRHLPPPEASWPLLRRALIEILGQGNAALV